MRKMTREIQNFEKYTYMYVYVCCFFPRSRAVMRNNLDSSNDKSKDLGGLITMVLVCVYQNPHLVNSWFELYYKQLHALNIIRTKFINIVDSSNCSCEKWEDTYHFFFIYLCEKLFKYKHITFDELFGYYLCTFDFDFMVKI